MSWHTIVTSVILTGGMCYGAHQIRLGLKEQGEGIKSGLKGFMSDAGSGTNHLADGLQKLEVEIGRVSNLLWGKPAEKQD